MSTELQFHATTICAVRKSGKTAIAGDGQVTFGQNTIMKSTARKVRRIYTQGAGRLCRSVADAFTLFEKFEAKLETYNAICSARPSNSPRSGARTR